MLKVVTPKKPKSVDKSVRFSLKKYVRFFPLVLTVFFSFVALAWTLPFLPQKPSQTSPKQYRGVLEMWNVESFEGGSGSRSSWLTSRAAQFEKKNTGLFVHVTNLTEEQLLQKIDDGETFDLVSFSRGVGATLQSLLQPYSGSVANIRKNMLDSGMLNGSVYALPLYAGAYCLFAREEQLPQNADLLSIALTQTYTRKVGKRTYELSPLICGYSTYICPEKALAASGVNGDFTPDKMISQYSAYEAFVANKTAVTLLGTQRDLYRLGKREEAGKIEKLAFSPLFGYNDLVQYVGISAETDDKTYSAMQFVQYLVSETCQKTLINIKMFSVSEISLYTLPNYLACEKNLSESFVPNVFAS